MADENNTTNTNVKEEGETQEEVFLYETEGCKAPYSAVIVEVAEGITSIPNDAFEKRKSLVEVRLPSTITSIGNSTFYGCIKLEKVNLPDGLISIGYGAFHNCHQLNNILLPATLESIGTYAFSNCRKLESIVIPDKITTINSRTFEYCQSLTSVTLPPTIESLGDDAFKNCISLTNINIPNTIQSIEKSCFEGCLCLDLNEEFLSEDVKATLEANRNNPWSPSSKKRRRENIDITEGPGATNSFKGKTQRNYGPEYWSITIQQLKLFEQHPLHHRRNENWEFDFKMREFVDREVLKNTEGLGYGLALLLNRLDPRIAHVMVSHAWDEPVPEFADALKDSNIEGPYWICSSAIYQNNKKQYGPTIEDQLGTNPEYGPFATVLRTVNVMVAIQTTTCNIYTRLWCVYEMYMARKLGVKVVLSPSDGGYCKSYGYSLQYNPCIANAAEKVDSVYARCGHPSQPMNDDERTIRRVIEASPRGFVAVDEAVELIRFEYLIGYDTETIEYETTKGRNHLRKAIEMIMARLPLNDKLIDFDSFLARELQQRPTFESVAKNWDYREDDYKRKIGNHDYYIMNKESNAEKIDVYQRWIELLKEGLNDINNVISNSNNS